MPGVQVIAHARSTVFQMAEVTVPRHLFRRVLELIDGLRMRSVARCWVLRPQQPSGLPRAE
jgi:hypothetical protein